MSANHDEVGLFPIRTVSELTGVNSVTLRAWERRYGIVSPRRTPKGHRLYTQQDIDCIRRVLGLLEQGVPISRARAVLEQSLPRDTEPAAQGDGPWPQYQQRMIEAIARFDEPSLEKAYNDAMSLYPADIITRMLLLPLLHELGERWQRSEGGVAEEHFFSVYLRNKLGARFHHRGPINAGQAIIAACLPGEHHELGLLLFTLAAHDRGLRFVLLGSDMPLLEIPEVVRTLQARAVVLSGSVVNDIAVIRQDLPLLTDRLSIPVFVGGRISITYRGELQQAGAIVLGEDLFLGVQCIQQQLQRPSNADGAGDPE